MSASFFILPRSSTRSISLRTTRRTVQLIAKCEFLNPTGSHKDRESLALVTEARALGSTGVCCASTGNLARSLSYFARLAGITCHVWINPHGCSPTTKVWLEVTGCVRHYADESLKKLYEESNRYATNCGFLNANPGQSRRKVEASAEIMEELLAQHPNVSQVFTTINNGTHALGLIEGAKRKGKDIRVDAAYTWSKICSSIAGFAQQENPDLLRRAVQSGHLRLHEVKESEILEAGRLMTTIGYHVEPTVWAALAVAVRIDHLQPNCAVILTGAAANKLDEFLEATDGFPLEI